MIDVLDDDDGIWGYVDSYNEFQLVDNQVQEYKVSSKTEEEIISLMFEENIGLLERSIYIITKGKQEQKYSVFSNLC